MCCPSCCSCDVVESSAVPFHKRVILVLKDTIYVTIILYS
jgi:hypothetical protein